jgi:hypothetical protein
MRLAAETSADSRSLLQQSQGGHAPRLRQHPEPHHPAHLIIPGVCVHLMELLMWLLRGVLLLSGTTAGSTVSSSVRCLERP